MFSMVNDDKEKIVFFFLGGLSRLGGRIKQTSHCLSDLPSASKEESEM